MIALWPDRYRPSRLEQLTFHEGIDQTLKSLANSKDMPHLLLAGPSGSGKMSRIRSLLCGLFDGSTLKMKIDEKLFQTPSGRKVEVTLFASNFHVELNPSEAGIYDRVVVQEIIKEFAQSQQLDKSKSAFKVAVILEADRLSRDAQQALRRTMEKYSSNLRLILCCTSSSPIIDPIKSRCLLLRIPSPTDDQIRDVLVKAIAAEGAHVDEKDLVRIIRLGDGNARRAMLACESTVNRPDSTIEKCDWEKVIDEIVSQIARDKSPASLLSIRVKLYDLLAHAIPPQVIIKCLLLAILPTVKDPPSAKSAIGAAATYEHRLAKGSKAIFHLEAFIAKLMTILLSSQSS